MSNRIKLRNNVTAVLTAILLAMSLLAALETIPRGNTTRIAVADAALNAQSQQELDVRLEKALETISDKMVHRALSDIPVNLAGVDKKSSTLIIGIDERAPYL